jgi:hypothetical protein
MLGALMLSVAWDHFVSCRSWQDAVRDNLLGLGFGLAIGAGLKALSYVGKGLFARIFAAAFAALKRIWPAVKAGFAALARAMRGIFGGVVERVGTLVGDVATQVGTWVDDAVTRVRTWLGYADDIPSGNPLHPDTLNRTPTITNNSGELYPDIIDPRTNKRIPFPEGDLKRIPLEKRAPWDLDTSLDERGKFIDEWMARGFPKPKGKYILHHIKPREFGGENTFWNLVPLTTSEHKPFNKWWLNYGDPLP